MSIKCLDVTNNRKQVELFLLVHKGVLMGGLRVTYTRASLLSDFAFIIFIQHCIVFGQKYDLNLDGELNRDEFVAFISQLTKDTFITVSQGLIITLAVAPTLALLTKRTTEGVPVVGKVVEKLPSSIYASLVTLTIVLVQQAAEAKQ
ncbi:PREDICTED: uncharacterized protein LOC109181986 isoform X2 [Ipomoea nil]|uniref:uncharacterized protein LOC109181986 isoform X2 n=1 Tax=Ipomoea nil TaxID=35883 RepID=UPI000901AEB4|nr:PREDICTED: uncharacterized protein LOC109181986 isoform X2 [Ipomoea nil]